MLDTLGKLWECIILQRLEKDIILGGLSPDQYDFPRGRSTVDAIHEALCLAKIANDSFKHGHMACCLKIPSKERVS